jgi:hypothetical protein
MATLYSDKFDTSGNVTERRWVRGQAINVVARATLDAALTSATNTTNTYYSVQLIPVRRGMRVVNWNVSVTDLDTHTTATLTFNLGDGGDATRFASALTTGQAGGTAGPTSGVTMVITNGLVSKGLGYTYTEDDTIDFFVQTAPATSATTGAIQLAASFYCGP